MVGLAHGPNSTIVSKINFSFAGVNVVILKIFSVKYREK
jgi:hypothetical protein